MVNEVLDAVRGEALKALDRAAPYGPDIDVREYLGLRVREPAKLEIGRVEGVGIDLRRARRTAMYMQVDGRVVESLSRLSGVEVTTVEDFIGNYPDIAKELLWRLIKPGQDKYTAIAALKGVGGYYVRVKRGVKVSEPIQTCLFMASEGLQAPHNLVILEEGAEATIVTGCTIMPEVFGLHAGITEFYVMEGAKLSYVMIHAWNRGTHVRPRSAALLEDGASMVMYYMNLSRVKTLQTYPKVILKGDGSKVYASSMVLGRGDSVVDVGTEAVMVGDAASELVSRFVVKDESRAWARARVSGVRGRGHIECKGLILSSRAALYSVPELGGTGRDVMLTHEASIGRIAEEEIAYLVSKGFSREEAEELIVRGFMNVEVRGLTGRMESYVKNVVRLMSRAAM